MITVEKFNEKSWEGDNRWRRVELEKISEELNIEIIGSNKEVFDRINERLVIKEALKKRSWEGENRWRRVELNEMATRLCLSTDGSNQNVYNRVNGCVGNRLKTNLFVYQKDTVNRMRTFENKYDGGMLLTDAGLGKTICCVELVLKSTLPTLIVCPASLVDNWENEFKKHSDISSEEINVYHGGNRILKDTLVTITSYTLLSNEKTFLNKFKRVIMDEAHFLRNKNTKCSERLMEWAGENINVKKWIVTATPIFNSGKDCYVYFNLLGVYDTSRLFNRSIKGISGLKKLNELIKKYSIKYTKDKVQSLKEKEYVNMELNFEENEKVFYDYFKDYSLKRVSRLKELYKRNKINDGVRRMTCANMLVLILRLKQCCNSPWLIINQDMRINSGTLSESIEKIKEMDSRIDSECPICYDAEANITLNPCGHKLCNSCYEKANLMRCHMCRAEIITVNEKDVKEIDETELIQTQNKVSTKIRKIQEIVENVVNKGEKIVIVSQWIGMLELIKSNISQKSVCLQGDVSLKGRTEMIKAFNASSDISVCFISLLSSAEGINLTGANHMILVDKWWNDSKMLQVICRIHRIGQDRDCKVYNIQIKDSIEKQIDKMIMKKKRISGLCMSKWITEKEEEEVDTWINDSVKLVG